MEWMNEPQQLYHEDIEPLLCIADCSLCIVNYDSGWCIPNLM